MSSKHYIENGRIKENIRAENVRTNEDVILISNLDDSKDIWIVEGDNEKLYLEWGYNLCDPFYYD